MFNKTINKILLRRVHSEVLSQSLHPKHIPPLLTLKYIELALRERGYYDIVSIDDWIYFLNNNWSMNEKLKNDFDVIILFLNIFNFRESCNFASNIKDKDSPIIIAISHDAASMREEYSSKLDLFDIVLIGEAENEVIKIIEDLQGHQNLRDIKLHYKQHLEKGLPLIVDDLNYLPVLRWSKEEMSKYPSIYPLRISEKVTCGYLDTSRGCPHDCAFCSPSIRKSFGKKVRYKNPIRVVEEIETQMRLGANVIFFEDDNFTSSREHVINVCTAIKRQNLNIKWVAQSRIDEVDISLLTLMKDAGCILLIFGIESGSTKVMNRLEKVNKNCNHWFEIAVDIFKTSSKLDIATCALFMVGLPLETREDIECSIELAKRLMADIIKVHIFSPYPGSRFYELYKDKIEKESIFNMFHYNNALPGISDLGVSEIGAIQRKFYRKIFLNPRFLYRHITRYGYYYIYNLSVTYKLVKKLVIFLFSIPSKNESPTYDSNKKL